MSVGLGQFLGLTAFILWLFALAWLMYDSDRK